MQLAKAHQHSIQILAHKCKSFELTEIQTENAAFTLNG